MTPRSKDDLEPIVGGLDRQVGQTGEHVGTHVREHDALAVELRAMLDECRIVEMKGNLLLVEGGLADEEIDS